MRLRALGIHNALTFHYKDFILLTTCMSSASMGHRWRQEVLTVMQDNETHELVYELSHAIGEPQVKFDNMTRLLYSTDASNYQIMPVGVTFPRTSEDVIAIHELAYRYRIPVLPRGAGTSLAGQTVSHAIVMDFSRHLSRVR